MSIVFIVCSRNHECYVAQMALCTLWTAEVEREIKYSKRTWPLSQLMTSQEVGATTVQIDDVTDIGQSPSAHVVRCF